ncbi:dihydrolipoyl dehydrogenase [Candidatus Spongiihabitans sp.]|uniref:dihydrolipoyl dehydrogenase n=1 Tax=Candidatus Spongiihabitans sp. TaxID=3101308 RepID=UPI003C7E2812
MTNLIEIKTPDLGEFENVPIIEIFVQVGDVIATDDPLVAIESDKATMEIPASHSGVIKEMKIAVGDAISSGQVLLVVESRGTSVTKKVADEIADEVAVTKEVAPKTAKGNGDKHAALVVLGSGPGGYTAAFRAADLGLDVILIERHENLGGVCLNVGCIPSKALLHVAKVVTDAADAKAIGLDFAPPTVDLKQTLKWKNGIVNQLTQGLAGLAKKRKVTVIHGLGQFISPNRIEVASNSGAETVSFEQAIIAAGSQPIEIPGFPHADPRLLDSTSALALDDIPERLLIVGGGIIGLEMATVYHALGSKISVVEMLAGLMAGADADLVRPLQKRIKHQYENIWLKTKVTQMKALKNGIKVSFEGDQAPENETFGKVLVSVGRTPNGNRINAQAAGVSVSEHGFIAVNDQQQTNIPHIFAIGDIVGQPMLAHKAVHEGKVAAEVAAGLNSGFDARVIPSVAYTDPEVAWVGVTEAEAKAQGLDYGKGVFPWAASGRSLSQGRRDGVTKLLFDNHTHRIIGAGITGSNAGELIAEATLAIEMNADAADIGLSIHAHPTLAETLGLAAEAFEGTITDLYLPKKK